MTNLQPSITGEKKECIGGFLKSSAKLLLSVEKCGSLRFEMLIVVPRFFACARPAHAKDRIGVSVVSLHDAFLAHNALIFHNNPP